MPHDVVGIARVGVGRVQDAYAGGVDNPDHGVRHGGPAALVGVDVVERTRVVEDYIIGAVPRPKAPFPIWMASTLYTRPPVDPSSNMIPTPAVELFPSITPFEMVTFGLLIDGDVVLGVRRSRRC